MNVFELCAVLKLNKDAYEKGLQEAESESSSAGGRIGNIMSAVGKATVAGLTASAVAVTKLVKDSVEAYAQYEQLVGGVRTLFGTEADTLEEYAKSVGKSTSEVEGEFNSLQRAQREVFANASEAYKNAGMSMNEYMETVTGFSASLIKSCAGDTEKASKLADIAITDMSDNANKMGSDMESIKNAYAGFAKENFTMLDNLKLGYSGSKEGMEQLLADAEKISGIHYDTSSYSDIVEAIHIIQDEMGIAGTTAKEAEDTISGSLNMVKASWQNVVTGLASGNGDLYEYIDGFVSSIKSLGRNVLPVVKQVIGSISLLVKELLPQISSAIPSILNDTIPSLLEAVLDALVESLPILLDGILELVIQVAEALGDMFPELVPAIISMVVNIVDTLVANIPKLIDGALKLVVGLAQGLIKALPELIKELPKIIVGITDGLAQGIPQIIATGVDLLVSLVANLPQIIVEIVKAIPQIIAGIIKSVVSYYSKLAELGKNLITKLGEGILSLGSWIYSRAGEIATNVVNAIKGLPSRLKDIGVNLVKGLWEGIKSMATWLWDKITSWANSIISGIAETFGIASPSRVMRDKIGKFLPMGIAVGMDKTADTVLDSANAIKSDVLDAFEEMNAEVNSQLNGDYAVDISSNGSGEGYSIRDVFDLLSEYLPQVANTQVVLDTGATVGQLAPAMDVELGRRLAFAQRGV